MTGAATLASLRACGAIGPLDEHFARALCRVAGEDDERVRVAAAMASRQVGHGHVCLPLPVLCRGELALELDEEAALPAWPDLEAWQRALGDSRLVGATGGATPLYLDAAGRLYLRRYFEHEQRLARSLRRRASAGVEGLDRALLERGLDRLFGEEPGASGAPGEQLGLFSSAAEPDLQRRAAEVAVGSRLCVVSGGPGTGKTSTVVKILALIAEQRQARGQAPARTLLMAPTGKAAQRLGESIGRAKAQLECTDGVRAAIAEQATTIHRALGVRRDGGFWHDADRPLATDLVVVDEASMVDLSLMDRLFDAVPEAARVILLGDRDQLASVEAGAVLGDVCAAGQVGGAGPLAGSVVHLEHSYRYDADSGIGRLARAINAADVRAALDVLDDPAHPDVVWVKAAAMVGATPSAALGEVVREGFGEFVEAGSAEARLSALGRFRVLCAHRHGPFGLLALNRAIEGLLGEREAGQGTPFYAGRPILITRNDYQARLFNGDTGVLWPAEGGKLGAYFEQSSEPPRRVAPARLPEHETAFATSVHKSQGSELDAVAVVLPDRPSPLLSRELLYTAVTRARRRVVVFGPEAALATGISTAVQRASGLVDALAGVQVE